MDSMFAEINYLSIKIEPCFIDQMKLRVMADLNSDISELMPYLNRVIKGAIYNNNNQTLTLRDSGKLITLFATKITATKLENEIEAKNLLNSLVKLINETNQNRAQIEPDYSRGVILHPLQVYKLLPKMNCKQCGEPSCLAFSSKLVLDQTNIQYCLPLFKEEFSELKKGMLSLLEEAGLCVPETFI